MCNLIESGTTKNKSNKVKYGQNYASTIYLDSELCSNMVFYICIQDIVQYELLGYKNRFWL